MLFVRCLDNRTSLRVSFGDKFMSGDRNAEAGGLQIWWLLPERLFEQSLSHGPAGGKRPLATAEHKLARRRFPSSFPRRKRAPSWRPYFCS